MLKPQLALLPILAILIAIPGIANAYDDWEEIGSARYKFGPWHIYDATLFASGDAFNAAEPFALELEYAREFRATSLAARTIKEIAHLTGQKAALFADLEEPLTDCFADVERGDTIVGVALNENDAEFYWNADQQCTITYPNFRDLFFGIWLSENSRRPDLSRQLTGKDL